MDIESRSTLFSAYRQSRGFSLLEVMVALAILGVAIVAIFQLFSTGLRATKKSDDYTKAIFYARSLLDEAYSISDPEESSGSADLEGYFDGSREVDMISSSDDGNVKLYEIIVKVTWPPSGKLTLRGLRTVYEPEE